MTRLKYNDQYHTYWIDGQKATGVSTVAKGFQDSYNIDRKIKRDVAKGMARRPDLCTMVAALGDDEAWETKKKIDKIATDAIEASGAWAKANHGTAKHTILERVHKGLPLDDVFDDRLVAYADAYQALMEGSGLTPIAELTERFIVYPDLLIAGRLDCAYLEDARFLLGDFKSGARAVAYPHSIVAQLGLYLNAPFLYNEATDEFDPAPLWGDTIIVAHVPDDLEQFGLWTIDAGLARTVALAALERHRYIRADADTLVKQWIVPAAGSAPNPPPAPVTDAPSAWVDGEDALVEHAILQAVTQPADAFDGLDDGHVAEPAKPERRAWVIGRLETLKTVDGALAAVGVRWPSGLATLKQSDLHTDQDLDRIVAVLDVVEAEYTVTFPVKDPTIEETTGRWTTPSPVPTNTSTTPDANSTSSVDASSTTSSSPSSVPSVTTSPPLSPSSTTDEGPPADSDAVTVLQKTYAALDDGQRTWIAAIARDAQTAGRPIHLHGHATVRRFEIVRGLVTLAASGCGEDDVVRGLIRLTLQPDFDNTGNGQTTGQFLSILEADYAQRFADACQQLADGNIVAVVDPDNGHLSFTSV